MTELRTLPPGTTVRVHSSEGEFDATVMYGGESPQPSNVGRCYDGEHPVPYLLWYVPDTSYSLGEVMRYCSSVPHCDDATDGCVNLPCYVYAPEK